MKRALLVLLVVILVVSVFASCGRDRVELPKGIQEVTGLLKPVPLSPTRRGTHVMEINGKAFTFVESSESLTDLEQLRVTARGTFEENTDESLLPVLVATDVHPTGLVLRQWKNAGLKLTLNAPEQWAVENEALSLRFTTSGALQPVLIIEESSLDELPSGENLVVGGQHAMRVRNGSGETVYVKRSDSTLVRFAFSPTGNEEQRSEAIYAFRQVVLRSVTFTGLPPSSAATSKPAGTGAQLGQPCGGEAGILCPTGQYCEVTDSETNVGRCKSL